MKTAFLLTFPALLVGHCATAQQFRLGAKAGVNYTDLNIRHVGGFKHLVGLNAGVVGRYALSQDGFWNVQAELLYSGKGQRSVPGFVPGGTKPAYANDRLHCLDLPVLAKINADGLTFEAGPQVSYILASSVATETGRFNNRPSLRPVQLGYAVGIGYELAAGYSLTIRYAADVSGIYKSAPFFDSVHSTAFQAQLGYLLGKGK